MEKSIFKISSILAKEITPEVENAKENDDKEVLVTVLKQHVDRYVKKPSWTTMVKIHPSLSGL